MHVQHQVNGNVSEYYVYNIPVTMKLNLEKSTFICMSSCLYMCKYCKTIIDKPK